MKCFYESLFYINQAMDGGSKDEIDKKLSKKNIKLKKYFWKYKIKIIA